MTREERLQLDEALAQYRRNFNQLPFEVRAGLPDLFTRWQETEMMIAMQENLLARLRRRSQRLQKEFLEWYQEQQKILKSAE